MGGRRSKGSGVPLSALMPGLVGSGVGSLYGVLGLDEVTLEQVAGLREQYVRLRQDYCGLEDYLAAYWAVDADLLSRGQMVSFDEEMERRELLSRFRRLGHRVDLARREYEEAQRAVEEQLSASWRRRRAEEIGRRLCAAVLDLDGRQGVVPDEGVALVARAVDAAFEAGFSWGSTDECWILGARSPDDVRYHYPDLWPGDRSHPFVGVYEAMVKACRPSWAPPPAPADAPAPAPEAPTDAPVSDAPRFDRKNPRAVALRLVEVMGLDNNVVFESSDSLLRSLTGAVETMMESGLDFSDETIFDLAAGEASDVQIKYGMFGGFFEADLALNQIFDGPSRGDGARK